MGLIGRLVKKRQHKRRIKELGEDMLRLRKLMQQEDTEGADSIAQRLTRQVAELEASISGRAETQRVAELCFDLGLWMRELNHDGQAEQAFQSALRLSAAYPQKDTRRVMAACYNHLGILSQEAGALEQARQYYEEGLALREKIQKSLFADEENSVYMGGTLCNLGHVAQDQNDLDAALAFYHRSIDILDKSIPGCDCGCRDARLTVAAHIGGGPSAILLAQQFLANALGGRFNVAAKLNPDCPYQHVRCSEEANCTVVTILDERLVGRTSGLSADDRALEELKRELLTVVTFAANSIVFDMQAVKAIDADGAALLRHLRGRLVGSGEWPSLCGLSDDLRASTWVPWEELFSCYGTVEDAVKDLGSDD